MDLDRVRSALTGPVASVSVPFDRDGSIHEAGLCNFIEAALAGGVRTVMLTYGDSLYSILSDQEVAAVTRLVVGGVAGRALVIAADRIWWTGQTVAFAEYAHDLGADLLMVLPPNWAASCTPATLTEHYAAAARVMPVMVVTNVFAGAPESLGLATLRLLVEAVPGVVAVKDDICGEFGRKLGAEFHSRLAIVSGGQKQNHLDAWAYGCDGYLSTFVTFRPEITRAYCRAIEAGDLKAATAIIREQDMPLFDLMLQSPGGFDAAVHGILELHGIAPRWRRPPYHSLTDAELDALAAKLQARGWL